jgi:hypothetical protein
MGSSYLPPPEQNVVNVGDELSQTALDAINAASFPSGTNPFRTLNDGGVISPYDNFKVYQTGDVVTESGLIYVFNSTIGAAGYGPTTHPYAWTSMVGPPGPAGSNGSDGQQGIQGDRGDTGPQGPPGQSVPNYRGSWDGMYNYYPNDVVEYSGSSYVNVNQVGSGSSTPPAGNPFYWQLLARAGYDGSPGGDGPQGQTGPMGPSGQAISEWNQSTDYPKYSVVWDVSSFNDTQTPYVAKVDIGNGAGSPANGNSDWSRIGQGIYVDWASYNNTLSGKVNRGGDSFTGRVNMVAPTLAIAGLNIGSIDSTSILTNSVAGDVWIGRFQLTYKNAQGNVVYGAATNIANVFGSPQIIDTTNSAPALRVTQKGTGNALLVEDSLNPDTTALVVDTSGNVGIGVATGYTATQKLEVVGNVKATALMTGSGPAFSVNSLGSHSGGSHTNDIFVSINGSTYRIPATFVSTP